MCVICLKPNELQQKATAEVTVVCVNVGSHTNTHACCLIDIQITFQRWIHTYLLCCEFAFCFSLCFIVYGPCELASWKKIQFTFLRERREKNWRKEKTTTTTNHQAVIVCTGDCQFLTSCFYWNFSNCNYTWTFGTTCTLIIIIFFSSFNRFFQPFKITVHLPPHTTRLYKTLQSCIVKKEEEKKQQIATIPSLNIAFAHKHTHTHRHAFACIQMCTHEHKHTRAQSSIPIVSHHSQSFSSLHVYGCVFVWFSLRARVCVYVCCCVHFFYSALKWKWIKAVHRGYCCCVFVLAVYLSSFFRSLFGSSLSNSFIWFDFFNVLCLSFFQWISFFFFIYSHTQNTIHSLTWMQKK